MPRASPRSAASSCTATRARCIARATAGGWRPTKARVDAPEVVVALGPWAPDVLEPLGLKLPMAVKRGYHRHFRGARQCRAVAAGARRRIRLPDHADGAGHPPHHRRGIRRARCAADAGAVRPADAGARASCFRSASAPTTRPGSARGPCFPDSRPVIGRAPGQPGLWLAIGHAHWGLTLGPVTGRLIGRDDGGRDAVLRSGAVSRGALLARRR